MHWKQQQRSITGSNSFTKQPNNRYIASNIRNEKICRICSVSTRIIHHIYNTSARGVCSKWRQTIFHRWIDWVVCIFCCYCCCCCCFKVKNNWQLFMANIVNTIELMVNCSHNDDYIQYNRVCSWQTISIALALHCGMHFYLGLHRYSICILYTSICIL